MRVPIPIPALLAAALAPGPAASGTEGGSGPIPPTPPGRSLEEILRKGPVDRAAIGKVKDLIERYDAAREEAVRRVLAGKIAVLVRRNLRTFTEAAQSDGADRRTAIRALSIAVAPDAVVLMIKMLDASKAEIRLDAIRALGELRDTRATESLLEQLQAREPAVRAAAAQALGKIADRRSAEPIIDRLEKEREASVRVALAESLGVMRAPEGEEPLQRLVKSPSTPAPLRKAAEKALESIRQPDPDFKLSPRLTSNPLPAIAEQMDAVEGRLEYYWSGKRTQRKQEQVIKALDDLIKMLEEQQQGGGGQSSGQSGQGGSRSASGGGSGGSSPAAADVPTHARTGGDTEHRRRRIVGIKWGNLPPAVRAEVEQALRESLPERYRRLLESYTKALAEVSEQRR